jgi:MFS family permease
MSQARSGVEMWAGRLADRRGRRSLMILGASMVAVSVAGLLAADSVASLIAIRLLSGVGEAFFFVAAFAAVVDLAPPERRGEAFSFASLALYIGIGIGPFIGEAVIELFGPSGFTAAWITAIALAAVAALLCALLPPIRPETEPDADTKRYFFMHPKGILPGVVLLATVWGMAGFLAFVPLFALDLGMSGAGAVLALFSGIVVLVRSIGGKLPDILGYGRSTRIALALSAVGLATVGLWLTPTGLFFGTAVFGLGVALFTPALFSLAVEHVPPAERGAVLGTVSAFLDIGLGLGPATLGFVAASVGRPGTFLAGSVVAALGLILVLATHLGSPDGRKTADT